MSGEWIPLAICFGTVALLLFSGLWANKRFADFDQLPGHFDFKGRATRLAPRRTMVWLLPLMFSVMMVGYFAVIWLAPQGASESEASGWLLFAALCLLASQAFVLHLTDRWARKQHDNL